jgi:hypothetical protein
MATSARMIFIFESKQTLRFEKIGESSLSNLNKILHHKQLQNDKNLNISACSGPIFKISSATLQSLYFPGHEGVI